MFTQIRRKPKSARQQYAFWSAVGITGVIALLWAVTLQYRFDDAVLAEESGTEYTGAFSQFLDDAKQNFANVFSAFGTTTPAALPAATTTESGTADQTPTTTPFTLTPRATSTPPAPSEPREVRIETTQSERGTTTAPAER